MTNTTSTKQQLNNLIEFRQAVYGYGFKQERDAQFELLDALTANQGIRSFPELSLSPFFRRKWCSAYTAVERGTQDRVWLRSHLTQQIATTTDGVVLMALDVAAWPRPDAVTLPDRQYVHSSTQDVTGNDIVVGQPYSLLAWVAEAEASWTLPVDGERVPSDQTERVEKLRGWGSKLGQSSQFCGRVLVSNLIFASSPRFLPPFATN